MPDDVQALLSMIGLRPIPISDLGRSAVMLPDYGLVLISDALGEDGLRQVVDRCLSAAAAELQT